MTNPPEEPPSPDEDLAYEIALHMVAFRDAETASETFNMLEAAKMISDAVEEGRDIDYERLGRLVAAMGAGPQYEARYEDDGTLVRYDEHGNEISRERSPQMAEYFEKERARKLATDEYVREHAPQYVQQLLGQLDEPGATEATMSLLIERGRKDGEILSQNELALATITQVRATLAGQSYKCIEDRRRVGPDGTKNYPKSQLTHTLLKLTVTKPDA